MIKKTKGFNQDSNNGGKWGNIDMMRDEVDMNMVKLVLTIKWKWKYEWGWM